MSARELGIIFGADSVRALLAGRKTVTRRLVKGDGEDEVPCRYRIGDRLWVRETWKSEERSCDDDFGCGSDHVCTEHCKQVYVSYGATPRVGYRAKPDGARIRYLEESTPLLPEMLSGWKTPLYMPRWASRLDLEVVDVRRERLLDITEADARSEGLFPTEHGTYLLEEESERFEFATAREAYFFAWDGINPRAPHDTNPRVDRIEFRRTTCRT